MMKQKNVSPYKIFKEWLLNPYPDAELPDVIIRAINPKTVMYMFGKLGEITIFLDEYFNNYDIMYCNPIELYDFLREIVQKYNIKKYEFSFFMSMKTDKLINRLQRKLPYLKKYEIYDLLERCQQDPDNDSFLENLNMKQSKVKKLRKKSKKEKTEIPKEALTFDNMSSDDIKTWEDWKNCFNE